MNSIEIDSVAYTIFFKLLQHSYVQNWDGRMGTYPPFILNEEERTWFQKFKETGEIRRENG